MKEVFHQIYSGIRKVIPGKKYFKAKSSHSGMFPVVGFLSPEKKSELENTLGISIKTVEFFEQALIHRSYLQVLGSPEHLSNERLEFLGDSILGMVVAEYLFSNHFDVLEGELTKMRSWLVNKKSLSICARKLRLNEFIMLSYSAEKSLKGGSDSILADALEAVIAAIYLDSGLVKARDFIIDLLLPIITKKSLMKDTNYKSILLENVQARGLNSPVYNVIEEKGPDHDKEFVVGVYVNNELLGTGNGKSKKQAEQLAAKKALEQSYFSQNN